MNDLDDTSGDINQIPQRKRVIQIDTLPKVQIVMNKTNKRDESGDMHTHVWTKKTLNDLLNDAILNQHKID